MIKYLYTPRLDDDGNPILDEHGEIVMDVTEELIDDTETPLGEQLEEPQPTKADLLKELEELTAKIKALK